MVDSIFQADGASKASAQPSHEDMADALRQIAESCSVPTSSLDATLEENIAFLPATSRTEVDNRKAQGDAVSLRLAAMSGVTAATLLIAYFSHGKLKELRHLDNLVPAILDAAGVHQIEDDVLRELAFDIFICVLVSQADNSPTGISIPHFQAIGKYGRAFLGLH